MTIYLANVLKRIERKQTITALVSAAVPPGEGGCARQHSGTTPRSGSSAALQELLSHVDTASGALSFDFCTCNHEHACGGLLLLLRLRRLCAGCMPGSLTLCSSACILSGLLAHVMTKRGEVRFTQLAAAAQGPHRKSVC